VEVAITSVGMSVQDTALTMFIILPSSNECKAYLTRIATPSRVYLIDTGNEGRAQDSRHPPPHPPVDLFLTGGRDESG